MRSGYVHQKYHSRLLKLMEMNNYIAYSNILDQKKGDAVVAVRLRRGKHLSISVILSSVNN